MWCSGGDKRSDRGLRGLDTEIVEPKLISNNSQPSHHFPHIILPFEIIRVILLAQDCCRDHNSSPLPVLAVGTDLVSSQLLVCCHGKKDTADD